MRTETKTTVTKTTETKTTETKKTEIPSTEIPFCLMHQLHLVARKVPSTTTRTPTSLPGDQTNIGDTTKKEEGEGQPAYKRRRLLSFQRSDEVDEAIAALGGGAHFAAAADIVAVGDEVQDESMSQADEVDEATQSHDSMSQ